MRCPTCSRENPSDAQFCMRCGTALTRTCSVCGASNAPESQFCLRCGAPLTGTVLSERRLVTVLFADLVGSTQLTRRIDPERMRPLIARYFETMQGEIRRFGGTVEKFIGDAVMAVFGLPVAHEDDPLRAARAALAMQQRMEALNASQTEPLHLRIAITTGEVVTDPLWSASGQFLATGETVNFAARLQSQAPPDGIVVDERTFKAVEDVVQARLMPAVEEGEFAGRSRWQITGVGEQPVIKRLRSKMVGRDDELQFLIALYRRVVDGMRPHVVTVIGPAGVGKTRLAEELLHALPRTPQPTTITQTVLHSSLSPAIQSRLPFPWQSPQILRGRCPAYGEGLTYWPLIEMLKQECGIKDSDPATTAAKKFREQIMAVCEPVLGAQEAEAVTSELAAIVGIELPRDYETMWRTRLQTLKYLVETRPTAALREPGGNSEPRPSEMVLQALRAFLSAKAQQAPLILLIEDLHWAEESLLELIEHLPAKTLSAPILILCLSRPDLLERHPTWGTGLRDYTAITLEPLPQVDSEKLIAGLVSESAIPEDVRRTVVMRAGGNPFFIEEILRMLVDEGNLVQEDSGWRWVSHPHETRIPVTIQALLLSRLDLLTPLEKRVIQDASVAGRAFWPGAITAMTGLTTVEATTAIERLQRRELVEQRPSSTLASEEEFTFTHALIREVAYKTLPKLNRSDNHRRFAQWLEQLGSDGEEFLEILAFHREQAWRNRYETGDPAPDIGREAIAALRKSAARAVALGTLPEARRLYERALTVVRHAGLSEEEAALYAELLIEHSEVVKWMRSPGPVFEDTELVLKIAPQIGREDLLARAWLSRAHAESDKGRLQPSEGALWNALELFRKRGDRQGEVEALELLGIITHALRGRLSKAQAAYREVLELYRSMGDARGTARTMAALSRASLDRGDFRQARPLAEEALRMARSHHERIAESTALYALGVLEHMAGASPNAVRNFEQAIAIRRELGDALGEANWRRQLGMHLLRQQLIDEAEREIQAGQALLSDRGGQTNPFFLRSLAEVYLARGDLVKASEYGEQAVAGLSTDDDIAQGTHRATLGKIRAAQGRAADAEELFAKSMEILKETEYRIDYALALMKHGEGMMQLGRIDLAADLLSWARNAFEDMGAVNFVKEIDAKLQHASVVS